MKIFIKNKIFKQYIRNLCKMKSELLAGFSASVPLEFPSSEDVPPSNMAVLPFRFFRFQTLRRTSAKYEKKEMNSFGSDLGEAGTGSTERRKTKVQVCPAGGFLPRTLIFLKTTSEVEVHPRRIWSASSPSRDLSEPKDLPCHQPATPTWS